MSQTGHTDEVTLTSARTHSSRDATIFREVGFRRLIDCPFYTAQKLLRLRLQSRMIATLL